MKISHKGQQFAKNVWKKIANQGIAGEVRTSSSRCSGPNSATTPVTKRISLMHKQSWIGPLKLIAASKTNCRDAGNKEELEWRQWSREAEEVGIASGLNET